MLITILIFGFIVGSFLNVCIYRIPRGESIIFPPSRCDHCQVRIKAYDLFPIISWMFLKRKCRNCKINLSIRYPLIELLVGTLFLLIYLQYKESHILIPYLIVSGTLVVVSFIDFDYLIIPNEINIFLLLFFMVSNLIFKYISWKSALLGALTGGGVFLLLYILSRGNAIGMGDVKLMTVLGLYLNWQNTVLVVFLSFILGGIFGVILLVAKIKERKEAIPFGPWISIATIITILNGKNLIIWYTGLL